MTTTIHPAADDLLGLFPAGSRVDYGTPMDGGCRLEALSVYVDS